MSNRDANREAESSPIFICDAMLGGLARWLRAAGYDAEFDVHFSDGELVRKAYQEDKVMLTSDSGILDRYAVTEGLVDYLYIPQDLDVIEQLAHVLGKLDLPITDPRCMECGGELEKADLQEVIADVPPKVQQQCSEYWICRRCQKVYWHGTHWDSISERLRCAANMAESLSAQ